MSRQKKLEKTLEERQAISLSSKCHKINPTQTRRSPQLHPQSKRHSSPTPKKNIRQPPSKPLLSASRCSHPPRSHSSKSLYPPRISHSKGRRWATPGRATPELPLQEDQRPLRFLVRHNGVREWWNLAITDGTVHCPRWRAIFSQSPTTEPIPRSCLRRPRSPP